MKQLLIVCIAALMTATFLAEDAAARSGVRKPRIVIYARPQYAAERGAIHRCGLAGDDQRARVLRGDGRRGEQGGEDERNRHCRSPLPMMVKPS